MYVGSGIADVHHALNTRILNRYKLARQPDASDTWCLRRVQACDADAKLCPEGGRNYRTSAIVNEAMVGWILRKTKQEDVM